MSGIPMIINQDVIQMGNFQVFQPGSIFMASSEKEAKSMIEKKRATRATPEQVEAVRNRGAKPADQAETPETRMASRREKRG